MFDPDCIVDYRVQHVFDYTRAVVWDRDLGSSRAVLIMDHLPNNQTVMITDFGDSGSPSDTWFVGPRVNISTREGFHGPFDIREAMIVHLLLLLEHK